MSNASLPDANMPFAPFQAAVPIPPVAWNDAPLVHVCMNETWATYVLGALQCLCVASTWASQDENAVRNAIDNGRAIVNSLMEFEDCPVAIQFRVDPDDDRHWEYSLDGGASWIDGPLTNVSAPDDAIITDPTTLLRNTIDLAATGADGLIIKALAQVGVKLQQGGIAAFFQKIPGLGLAADTVIQIAGGDTYDNPIIETTLP